MGGDVVFKKSNLSIPNMFSSVYPEYDWLPWKFTKTPLDYWNHVKNQRKFMDWAGKELGIKELDNWYNFSREVFST